MLEILTIRASIYACNSICLFFMKNTKPDCMPFAKLCNLPTMQDIIFGTFLTFSENFVSPQANESDFSAIQPLLNCPR